MFGYMRAMWARATWEVMSWLWRPAIDAEPDRPGDDDQFAQWLEEKHPHD